MIGLVTAIEIWAEHWNDDPKHFIWKKPAGLHYVSQGKRLQRASDRDRISLDCRLIS